MSLSTGGRGGGAISPAILSSPRRRGSARGAHAGRRNQHRLLQQGRHAGVQSAGRLQGDALCGRGGRKDAAKAAGERELERRVE